MDVNEQNFLNVLSCAIFNKKLELIEPVDFKSLITISFNHHLFPLVFEKLCEYPEFKNSKIYALYAPNVLNMVWGQAQRTSLFLQLYKKFNSLNIYPIVVKGIICRQLYGKLCDHRPSSDEDILVKETEFDKVCDLLESEGYKSDISREDIDLSTLQALGYFNKSNGMNIEVHVNPIGKSNSVQSEMDKYFHDIFDDYIEEDINNTKIRTFNYTNHFLFLIFHAFKHFTGSGFGIRQVLDLLLYEQEYENFIDWSFIISALKDTNCESFFADLISIGNAYLGFNLTKHCDECCPEELLNDLMSNGIFGNDTQAKKIAGTITSNAIDNNASLDGKRNALHIIFPSIKYMATRNPEINNNILLYPVRCVQRWGDFLKKNKSSKKEITHTSINIGNRRISLLKRYGIIKK